MIEEKIGNTVYLEPDIPEVKHLYQYSFKVEDDEKVLDLSQLTPESTDGLGLQFTVKNAGQAKITVSCEAGECTYIVKVKKVAAEKIKIVNAPKILDPETPIQLKADVTPGDATDRVVWSVDRKDLASISESVMLTPKKEGNVKVTAEANGVKDEVLINIKKLSSTDIYFKDAEGNKKYVQNGKIELAITESGNFFMEGESDGSVTVKRWHAEEYVYHPQLNERSFWFWIDRGNRYHPREVGEQNVTLTYIRDGNKFKKEFQLKVVRSDIEELKAYAIRDGKKVYLGDAPLPVAGSERVNVVVEGKRKGKDEFEILPDTAYEIMFKARQHIIGSSFALWNPGIHQLDIRMLDNSAKLSFKADSSYVAQKDIEGDVPKRWPIHDWNPFGEKFVGMRYHPMEEVTQYGSQGYTLRTLPANASYHELKWESLTPEIAEFDPLHANGLVPKKPGKAKFIASLSENKDIKREVEVEFYYLHPLKEVSIKNKNLKVESRETRELDIATVPENASEQRFTWTYSKPGIVSVVDKVNIDPSDVNVEKWTTHTLKGLKDGTVEVAGTPIDDTEGAKPIKFTVVVGNGGEEPKPEIVNKEKLKKTIETAKLIEKDVVASKDGKDVEPDRKWASNDAIGAFDNVIAIAEKLAADDKAKQTDVDAAVKNLEDAAKVFKNEIKSGLKSAEPEKPEIHQVVIPEDVNKGNNISIENGIVKYTIGESKGLTIRIIAEFSDFEGMYLDGVPVEKDNYAVSEGSIIIRFNKGYLDKLSKGKHIFRTKTAKGESKVELMAEFKDAGQNKPNTNNVKPTAKAENKADGRSHKAVNSKKLTSSSAVKTGDNQAIGMSALWLAAFIGALYIMRKNTEIHTRSSCLLNNRCWGSLI